jgi:hypothetical protein
MSKNTVDQFAELTSVVTRTMPRDLLPADMQYWIQHQAELTQLLDRAMRRTTEPKLLTIDYRVLPSLVNMEIVEHHVRSNTDQIDVSKVELILTLKPSDNGSVGGEENLKRLRATGKRLLDVRVMEELFQHPELIPESWKKVGAVYFWGTIFRNSDGYRFVAYLCWDGVAWYWSSFWLDNAWRSLSPAASLASSP